MVWYAIKSKFTWYQSKLILSLFQLNYTCSLQIAFFLSNSVTSLGVSYISVLALVQYWFSNFFLIKSSGQHDVSVEVMHTRVIWENIDGIRIWSCESSHWTMTENKAWLMANLYNPLKLSTGIQLAKFSTDKEIRDHLARLYGQTNLPKAINRRQLLGLLNKETYIQEFYTIIIAFWINQQSLNLQGLVSRSPIALQ